MNYLGQIKQFEGFAPRAQWDYAQNSNGYGTKARYPGEVIDRAEAERRFQAEIANARSSVERFAPNAPEGVKQALTSLTYNSGTKWTNGGLGQAVQSGDYDAARQRFLQYDKAGGDVLPGLHNRRVAEASWFSNPTSGGTGMDPEALLSLGDISNVGQSTVASDGTLPTLSLPTYGNSPSPETLPWQNGGQTQADNAFRSPSSSDPKKQQKPLPLAQQPSSPIYQMQNQTAAAPNFSAFTQRGPYG